MPDAPSPENSPPEASLVRTVRFSAGHRYWRPEWDDERNRRTFGASINRHGHNYVLEVTVRGPVEEETGFCVDLGALDELLTREVVDRLEQRDLVETLPSFAPGERIPTTEELVRWLFHHLEGSIPGSARLVRLRLHESDSLAAEYGVEHR